MKNLWESSIDMQGQIVEHGRARKLTRLVSGTIFAIIAVFANIAFAIPSFAQIVGTAQLNIERRGHTATLLDDGKVLIVGGDNQSGMISQAEIFDLTSPSISLSAASIVARTDHTATKLSDGRVIVIGGQGQNGALTSTEIYDPITAAFTSGPSLTTPRSGHTSTVLSDGKILIAGGDTTGSAELYNPVTNSFSLITGSMNVGRKFHSAILTSAGQVLIVGGVNAQNAILNTAEVFDPASQSFYMPPTDMQAPRALPTLKLLADGKVQIIGGDAELSMEVFDPSNGIFIAKALLPPNTDLLAATLSTQSRAALFSPSVSQDPMLQGVLSSEQIALLDRSDHSITELPSRNQALVAGGINSTGQILNSAKLVSSSKASVTTDKTDYAPGQIVTITGSGFQANEQVDIYFHEFPEEYPDVFLSATANQQGNFVVSEFAPQQIDLGRIFTLTAIGKSSGFTAQTSFKDAKGTITTIASDINPSAVGQSVTFTATIRETSTGGGTAGAVVTIGSVTFLEGGNNCNQGIPFASNVGLNGTGQATATRSFSTSGNRSIRACYSGAGSGSGATSNSDTSLVQNVNAAAAATTTIISAPTITYAANASVTVTVSATTGTPTGDVSLAVDGGTPVSKSLSGGSVTFTSTDIAALASPNAGDHSLSTNYTSQGNFAASSATGILHVNKASSTTTVTFEAGPYAYRGTAFTATAAVTGVGGLNQPVTVSYSGDCTNVTVANGCTATANFAGDTNHTGSSDSKSITIEKTSSTTTVTGGTFNYDGNPHPATVSVAGAGLNLAPTPSYSGGCSAAPVYVYETTPLACTATYTYAGDANHTGSSGSANIIIKTVFAFNGFYSPIGGSVETSNGGSYADPVRSFKLNSTIPVKFGATWLNGGAPLTTGIHTLQAVKYSNATDSEPAIDATPTDAATTGNQFRLTDSEWHFNLSTKGLTAGTWLLKATLVDGSVHTVWITIKK